MRPFYNILRQENNFEWTTEYQKQFEETKTVLIEQIASTNANPDQPFYAMCNISNFGTGAAFLQAHSGANKLNLNISKLKTIYTS